VSNWGRKLKRKAKKKGEQEPFEALMNEVGRDFDDSDEANAIVAEWYTRIRRRRSSGATA
jgi:hypothetical protein